MNIRQQDAIERLEERSADFGLYTSYLKERRDIYVQALVLAGAPEVEKLQGKIQVLDEVLAIPQTATAEKAART